MKKKHKEIQISCVGDTLVGKTCLLNSFFKIEDLLPLATIGIEKYKSIITLENGTKFKLIIWDTAGVERFRKPTLYILRKSGIIIAFDLTKRETFKNVTNWLKMIKEINNCPIALFGTKCDLKEKREISKEEAEEFAENNEMSYFETSAVENINIEEGITTIANDAYEYMFNIKNRNKNKNKNKKKILKFNKLIKFLNY